MRLRGATLIVASALSLAAFGSAPALAASEGPGWELFASSYPTNFGHGVSEVQQVVANETTGTFTLSYREVETQPIPDEATDAEVQTALEGLSSIGAGNVAVTGSTPGTYTVTFKGDLGNVKTAELEAGGASASVITEGAASGTIGIDVFNIGAGGSSGTITLTDTLPHGLKAKEAGELISPGGEEGFGIRPRLAKGVWECAGNGPGAAPKVAGATVVTCTNNPETFGTFAGGGGTPTFARETNHPQPAVGIAVEVESGTPEGAAEGNRVTIAGGGAIETASTTNPVTISTSPPVSGGLTQADAWFSNADGTIDRRAGSHPYAATFIFETATALKPDGEGYDVGGEPRNLETEVPPGFIGDLHGIPQCTREQLVSQICPDASMVGRLKVESLAGGTFSVEEQIYNMVPQAGQPAELGFEYSKVPVYVEFSVKSGGNYGIAAHVNNIPEKEAYQSILELWGVPEERSHDIWRHGTGGCSQEEIEASPENGSGINYCARQITRQITPFLRLPTSCGAPQQFAFRELNGWQNPTSHSEVKFLSHDARGNAAGFNGCEGLGLEPAFTAALESSRADSATGLTADVRPPLGASEEPAGLSPADLQSTTVVLPEGVVVNPGQAAGLQACPAGRPSGGGFGNALTTPEEEARGEEDTTAAVCPQASKVGTAVVKSQLIEADSQKQFNGDVYILPSNPPEIKLLIAATADGVNLKLVGTVHLNETTGRLEATVPNTPQLPFTDFKLSFDGARPALVTPARCGTSVASADFTPWSSPFSGNWLQSSSFTIGEGAGGAPCPSSPLPFAPSFAAGSSSAQAGGFTNITAQLQRNDGQQRIEKVQITAPPGLAGMIANVPPCPEPLAETGECGASSAIGYATVTAGPGSSPLTIPQPGDPAPTIYLTGPYGGAPFGLSIVTKVLAGPFNLGTIVTRAKIEIDPRTAQVTITTNPLPSIVKGVPTDIRSIEAVINGTNFGFNPTNCEESSFAASATGIGPAGVSEPSTTASLTSRFKVGACQSLKFTPQAALSTGARATKKYGQSLSVKISYPKGAMGTQAWFREAKLDIPKQLPAEDRTLQQACPAATFEANRTACPPHAKIGTALVHTEVLPVPLEGPVYFVSHGGAKFPDVVMLLSGDNVNIELTGETLIKNGVTSATFRNLPDVPFESIEVTLPTGEYSEFGGYTSAPNHLEFCGQKLSVPTFFKAQNGLELHSQVPVTVQGCPTKVSVRSHSRKGRTVTLSIYTPGAGKLKVGGRGLGSVTKSAHGQELITVKLQARRAGSYRARIAVTFTPTKGKRQNAGLAVKA